MLKFITVIVICYFGKLENNKSSIFGPATIFWTRDTRHAPIRLSLIRQASVCPNNTAIYREISL